MPSWPLIYLKMLNTLTILTGKNCVLLSSVQEWLLGCFWPVSYVYTINLVLYILLPHVKMYRCLKKVIRQIDRKNEWLLLSASFTAKFELVFVLKPENAFSERFHFKASRKKIGSSTKRSSTRESPLFKRSESFFEIMSGKFECFQ